MTKFDAEWARAEEAKPRQIPVTAITEAPAVAAEAPTEGASEA